MADELESRLLGLAAELRNRIYEMVFEDNEVDLDDDEYCGPGLLLACNQTHVEARGAYYRVSTFKTLQRIVVPCKLLKLARKHQHLINKVVLDKRRSHTSFRYHDYELAALLAQKQVLLLRDLFKEYGCTGLTVPGALQAVVSIYRAGEDSVSIESVRTDNPWQAFATQSNDQSDGTLRPSLKSDYRHMARFHDFEHFKPGDCWNGNWTLYGNDYDYSCGCPKKGD